MLLRKKIAETYYKQLKYFQARLINISCDTEVLDFQAIYKHSESEIKRFICC